MKYRGKEIDPIRLWENYVDFLPNADLTGPYLPLVFCPNPEHDNTRSPAFQINIRDGLVHCFSHCGISGTFVHAISMIEGCDERQARRIILSHRGELTRLSARRGRPRSTRPPTDTVPDLAFSSYIPQAGLEYLEARGITGESIARWQIGWDENDLRLVIPVIDENAVVRLLIRRAVKTNQQPKYLYDPPGVSKNSLLFGYGQIDRGLIRSRGIVLVEGSLDAVRLHQHGITNTVATLGTGISPVQCRLLSRLRPRRVYLFFDRDVAGIHGIELAASRLRKYPLYVVRYPSQRYDPAEFHRKEVRSAIDRAIPLSRFVGAIRNAQPGGR